MSLDATRWAWNLAEIPPTRRLVLLCLADHADPQGLCWPSVRRIADRCGIGSRTVRMHVAQLEAAGLLGRVHGRRVTTEYHLSLHLVGQRAASGGRHSTATPPEHRVRQGGGGRQGGTEPGCRQTVNESSTEYIIEGMLSGPPSSTTRHGTRLPPEWYPSAVLCEYATSRGLDPDATCKRFRHYYGSRLDETGIRTNWDATFRSWCSREVKYRNWQPKDKIDSKSQQTHWILRAEGRVSDHHLTSDGYTDRD